MGQSWSIHVNSIHHGSYKNPKNEHVTCFLEKKIQVKTGLNKKKIKAEGRTMQPKVLALPNQFGKVFKISVAVRYANVEAPA